MKISKTTKVVIGAALLAPLAMYAAAGDGAILSGALDSVKKEVSGPMVGILLAAEVVAGAWGYIQSKNPAVLIGVPMLMGFTAFALKAI